MSPAAVKSSTSSICNKDEYKRTQRTARRVRHESDEHRRPRIGKVKLLDREDGSKNKFVPFDEYLETEVKNTIAAAQALDTKLIRGFSFYHPAGEDQSPYIAQAVDQIGRIVDLCAREGLIYRA